MAQVGKATNPYKYGTLTRWITSSNVTGGGGCIIDVSYLE